MIICVKGLTFYFDICSTKLAPYGFSDISLGKFIFMSYLLLLTLWFMFWVGFSVGGTLFLNVIVHLAFSVNYQEFLNCCNNASTNINKTLPYSGSSILDKTECASS